MGRCGLVCDNVLSFEVVTADGTVRTADNENEPDLYWPLRGGGGNFGVVTSMKYRLYPIRTVLSGMIVHPLESGREVLRFYREFVAGIPDELVVYAAALTTPDGFQALALIPCYCGDDLEEGAKLLAPLRQFGSPVADTLGAMPYLALQQMLDGAAPYGIHSYWKSNFLESLTDNAVGTFVSWMLRCSSPLTLGVLEHCHGQVQRVPENATAIGLRKASFDLVILSLWNTGAAEPHIAWTREFWGAMQPWSAGLVYVNGLDADDRGRIRESYGANYPRLAAIKQQYDPTNLFRVNQNVRPARAAG